MGSLIVPLLQAIARQNPAQEKFLEQSLAALDQEGAAELEAYLGYSLGSGLDLETLARAYCIVVLDTLKEQIYFRRHGRYRHARFADVAEAVYYSAEYMPTYMRGLALTTYLWPNHKRIKGFFSENIPRNSGGTYLEIGPGHGLFFMTAMRLAAFDRHLGIDISPTSVEMTRGILNSGHFGTFRNFSVILSDFLQWQGAEQATAVVMGEVLEHVEQPELFLGRVARVAAPGAFIFVTTCLNAPAVDHIYLYESLEQIHAQVARAGLSVATELCLPYVGLSLEQCMAERLPVNVALVLSKDSGDC